MPGTIPELHHEGCEIPVTIPELRHEGCEMPGTIPELRLQSKLAPEFELSALLYDTRYFAGKGKWMILKPKKENSKVRLVRWVTGGLRVAVTFKERV